MSTPRFLWVSNHTPFLTDFGGGQRSNLIYRGLREMGEVDVLLLCPPASPGKTMEQTHGKPDSEMTVVEPLKRGQLRPWNFLRSLSPRFVDKAAYNLGSREMDYHRDPAAGAAFDSMLSRRHYDLIVARHFKYPGKAGAFRYGPLIVDVDDNEVDLYGLIIQDKTTSPIRRMVLRQRVKSLGRVLPKVAVRSDYLWICKEEDRAMPGCERASVLPNIPYGMSAAQPPEALPPATGSKVILFVGMLSYIYNAQGIDSFMHEAWPLIRARQPQAVFRLVGSRLSDSDRARWSKVPGVEVVGFVPDLQQAYREAAFVVVPIWSGGGTNIKVLEALMYGRTCVLSKPAHRGYGSTLAAGESVLVGADSQQIAAHCLSLLDDPQRAVSLSERGREVIARDYSYERFRRTVIETTEAALRSGAGSKMPLP